MTDDATPRRELLKLWLLPRTVEVLSRCAAAADVPLATYVRMELERIAAAVDRPVVVP
jgi:hypothetical protein